MATRKCKNGHSFEKSSSCQVCPICSSREMSEKFGDAFPKIGAPAFRALDSMGIRNISQLANYTEDQLLQLHGFGPKALLLIKEALVKKGLTFSEK